MEVLAFFLTLYFRTIIIAAYGNTLPLSTASSQIEPLKDLRPDKEALILNNFPIYKPDFPLSPNLVTTLPEIENGVAKTDIHLEGAASLFPPSLTNSFLNFDGNSAVKDFSPSISKSIGSSVLPFGCNSFTNDFSNLATTLPKIKNSLAKSDIHLEGATSLFPSSLTNSCLNFEGNSAGKDFVPSISNSVESSVPSFGCNSFTNDFSNLATTLPKIENSLAKSDIHLEGAMSLFPSSLTNSCLNFEGNSAGKDFVPSISKSVESSVPSFGCNSFTNDFSGAKCLSNFKALRDSIEAYANFISSTNSVFKLPMTTQSSGDSISKSFDVPFDSFNAPGTFDQPQPPCVQMVETISPNFSSFLNSTDSVSAYSQSTFPVFNFPKPIESCESPLVSHSSDLLTHDPCVKSFDTLKPDFGIVSESCQSYSQNMLPLLDFPRNIETCQSPLISSSRSTIPVFDFPIKKGQSSTSSPCTSPRNFLPTVSSLSTVNLSPNFLKFDSLPTFSSNSAFSLPITVNCIDCKSCSLYPSPPCAPNFSVQERIENCTVSTPNTLATPILPMSSPCPVCSSPLTVAMCSPPVFDYLLTDDLILNECPKVPTASSLPLSTDLGSCMISVKNLLPSLNGAKCIPNSVSPVPLALPSSLPKLQLATTSFPLLPKSPISLFNNSFFEIPDVSNRVSGFDNMLQSLVSPISSSHVSPNLSLPSANILTPNPLTPSFSCLTPSIVPIPSSSCSNCLSSTAIDLPSRYKESNSCNICGSSIVPDQTALNTFSHVPFPNFLDIYIPNKEFVPEPNLLLSDRNSEVLKNNDIGDNSFFNEILSMIGKV